MADYVAVPLYPEFGRVVTVEEVHDLVPLILIDGGPKDGWVYDQRDMQALSSAAPDGPGALHFEYAGEVAKLDDGRLARVYRPQEAS